MAKQRFISVRAKMLGTILLLLTLALGGTFFWFYNFVTDQVWELIKHDAQTTLTGIVDGIDGDTFEVFSKEMVLREDGYTDDRRYWAHVLFLKNVHDVEPRAFIYTYVKGDQPYQVKFIGSSGALNTPPDGAKPFEIYQEDASTAFLWEGLSKPVQNETFTGGGQDTYGSWGVTVCRPIYNSKNEVVGAAGIDFQTDYVLQVQRSMLKLFYTAIAIIFLVMLIAVFWFSDRLSRPITQLTRIAELIGEGHYDQDLTSLTRMKVRDEISKLAEVFDLMIDKVYAREQTLRQRVEELQIQIDEAKKQNAISEIVDTDFFRDLQVKAVQLRERKRQQEQQSQSGE
jgi:methyl-accepting chemotaxis protein